MKAWEIVSTILQELKKEAKVGVTKKELNALGEKMIKDMGAVSVSKGALVFPAKKPYPASIVISINDEIAHGMPTDYALKEGDLVNIDMGVKKDGVCGDAAMSIGIGEISKEDKRLLKVARMCLDAAVEVIRPGLNIGDIGLASYRVASQYGYVISKRFCGHGIGKEMHMDPKILHTYDIQYKPTEVLKPGMMICLEPIVTRKDNFGVLSKDKWTAVTRTGEKAAMFEHQVLVTETGYEILTTHLD